MKIKLVSDLHLEFTDINIENDKNYDVLILGGDIMIAEDLHNHPPPVTNPYAPYIDLGSRQKAAQRFRNFLSRVSDAFPNVIYVAGNHEFYHGKWVKSIEVLRNECARFLNVHFLELDSVTINDVTFIGGTLWTDCNKGDPLSMHAIGDFMNDFRQIRNDELGYTKLRPAHTISRHRRTLEYIKKVVEGKHDQKFVVVGHHAPSSMSVHEQYRREHLTNGAYYSDLSEFILDHPQIKLWTHGHTHHPFDYMLGETRVVCNPRGYEGYEPDSGWDPNILIEV